MASIRQVLPSLDGSDRGTRWANVAEVGKVRSRRTRQGRVRWFVDLRPYGRIFSAPGVGPLETERDAQRVLDHVQGELARGMSLEQILTTYLPKRAKQHLVETRLAVWLDAKRDEASSGDRSPSYLRELERYARPDGHFSWWFGKSILEITTAGVDDWASWLRKRAIAPKTRRNVVGAFRAFLGWLHRRGEISGTPHMPWVAVDEYSPTIVSAETQDAILAAIPEAKRGIFLALARLGLRPSEARVLQVRDWHDGWITVERAAKGPKADAPVRGTKTRRVRRLPVDEELQSWLERHLGPHKRLRGTDPLFQNPVAKTTDKSWLPSALRRAWVRACKRVGVEVGLYEGTKHAFATDAARRGVQERHIQAFLGHADVRSTRRYARLADQALVTVLRPGATSERQASEEGTASDPSGYVVEAAGIEPASA